MNQVSYTVIKKFKDPVDFSGRETWSNIAPLYIDNYMWMDNGYTPFVAVKLFHTEKNIYLFYHVLEDKITIKHTKFGSDVYKDSAVEFFINPFPESSLEYFNIEINALGIPLVGVGLNGDDTRRYYFKENEMKELEIKPSLKQPVTGYHGKDFWDLFVKIPKRIFENYYSIEFSDKQCIANFYKCGDETEFEHYGAWSRIENPTPDFSLTKYFGKLIFEEARINN